jgi:hypothetical protein
MTFIATSILTHNGYPTTLDNPFHKSDNTNTTNKPKALDMARGACAWCHAVETFAEHACLHRDGLYYGGKGRKEALMIWHTAYVRLV